MTWRIDPGRRAAAAVMAVVVLTAGLVGARLVSTRPRAQAVAATASVTLPRSNAGAGTVSGGSPSSASGPSSPSSGPSGTASPTATGSTGAAVPLVIDVVGRVRRPGLVHLPTGSRVDDAIRAAGGARSGTDLSAINLARVCVDGEQIAVGRPGAPGNLAPAGTGPVASTTSGPAAPVSLNSGTLDELQTLPGVGPVMAQRIIDWRTTHGLFGSVDQLRQVSGIGDVTFARLSPLVTV